MDRQGIEDLLFQSIAPLSRRGIQQMFSVLDGAGLEIVPKWPAPIGDPTPVCTKDNPAPTPNTQGAGHVAVLDD